MKIAFLILLAALLYSCAPHSYCTAKKNYLVKIDTIKAYNIKGTYCLSEKKDTVLRGNNGRVEFLLFDRITGKQIKNGVVYYSRLAKVKASFNPKNKTLINEKNYLELPAGKYEFGINNMDMMPLIIKDFEIRKDMVYRVNCYLGGSLQY